MPGLPNSRLIFLYGICIFFVYVIKKAASTEGPIDDSGMPTISGSMDPSEFEDRNKLESYKEEPVGSTESDKRTVVDQPGEESLVDAAELDDRTLLDTFGEAAKQYLTQKVIPSTDPQCKWDWRSVRCEPFCECEFLPKRGDYHIGRSCRRRVKEECDPVTSVPEANTLQLVIQRLVQGSTKVVDTANKKARVGYQKVQHSICDRMPALTCSDELPVLAWQERLFCRYNIPHCPGDDNFGD